MIGKKTRVVLIGMLVLPALLYIAFVYGLKDVFFEKLPVIKIGVEINEDGITRWDTVPYQVPDFSFINQDGETITRDSMLGNMYVASFFFATCPTICPAMNFHLLQVQERFKAFDDFYILSHTVDPLKDSIPALKAFALKLNADTRKWFFLTGERDDIYAAAAGYYLSAYEDILSPGGFFHAQSVVLVDWNGQIRSRKDDYGNLIGSYDVLDVTQLNALKEDIKVLKAEYERYKHNLKKK